MSYPFYWVDDLLKSQLVKYYPEKLADIAWKNLTFDPAGRRVWLKVINVPVSEHGATLGLHGDNELQGFIQIAVYSELNIGTTDADKVIGRVNQIFDIPKTIQAPKGCLLRLRSKTHSQGGATSVASYSKGGVEGNWDAHYITVYWLAREPKERM